MKSVQKLLGCAIILHFALFTHSAFAEHDDYQCKNIPKEELKTQQELHKKLTDQGWRIRQIKVTNGCFEVYGFDEKNARVEAFFDPRTLQSVQPLSPATVAKPQ